MRVGLNIIKILLFNVFYDVYVEKFILLYFDFEVKLIILFSLIFSIII